MVAKSEMAVTKEVHPVFRRNICVYWHQCRGTKRARCGNCGSPICRRCIGRLMRTDRCGPLCEFWDFDNVRRR